jgi:hypothetical protein
VIQRRRHMSRCRKRCRRRESCIDSCRRRRKKRRIHHCHQRRVRVPSPARREPASKYRPSPAPCKLRRARCTRGRSTRRPRKCRCRSRCSWRKSYRCFGCTYPSLRAGGRRTTIPKDNDCSYSNSHLHKRGRQHTAHSPCTQRLWCRSKRSCRRRCSRGPARSRDRACNGSGIRLHRMHKVSMHRRHSYSSRRHRSSPDDCRQDVLMHRCCSRHR